MEEILASIRRIIADDESKPIAEIAAQAQAAAAAQLDATRREPSETAIGGAANVEPFRDVLRAVPHDAGSTQTQPSAPAATPNGGAPVANGEPHAHAHALGGEDDVFQLTDDMALPAASPKGFRKVEPAGDLEFTEASPTPPPWQTTRARTVGSGAPNGPEVMSRATFSAVETAFNSLAATVLSNNARTLEDLVKEMLRPMLKNWLDDNLPSLVERLVRAEIERVSRGR